MLVAPGSSGMHALASIPRRTELRASSGRSRTSAAQSHGIRAPRRPRLSHAAPGFFSSCDGAYPFSGVTRGLDPRVHPLRKSVFAKKMDCRVKPGNDEGEIVPTILCPDSEVRIIVPHPGRSCMIRLISAAAAAALLWSASAAAQTAPATAGPVPAAVIEELVLANRILNDRGVLDAYGHVSIRHPGN